MKISTFVTMILFVGVILFVVSQMVNETQDRYDITINQSNWQNEDTGIQSSQTSKYDFAGRIEDKIQGIKKSIDDITSEDKGWFEKIGAGFTGIIKAVVFLPSLVWDLGVMGGSLVTGVGTSIGLPEYLILVFIIMLTVWGVFKLVEFFQRWQI